LKQLDENVIADTLHTRVLSLQQ